MTAYDSELEGLRTAYLEALTRPNEEALTRAARFCAGRSVIAVASGGAFPSARLAAWLHTARTGLFALAMTPLDYIGSPMPSETVTVTLLSATARHPDTELVAAAAIDRGHRVLLVTQRRPGEVKGALAHPSVELLTVPQPGGRDGFLATQSLLVTATTLARLYRPTGTDALLPDLPALNERPAPMPLRERTLILHGSVEHPAADDLEARLSETGLAAVQVADYRTLAHGRHFGLSRHLGTTTVISIAGPDNFSLAERTLSLLPAETDIIRLRTGLAGVTGVLDLLVQSMGLPPEAARAQGVHLSRPGVPVFGRRLYHLKPSSVIKSQTPVPVLRKLIAANLPREDRAAEWYTDALDDWVGHLHEQRIGALVLDYDGTVVATEARYDLPTEPVKAALTELLSRGLPIAFASGRGDSLHRDLRQWVPPSAWPQVFLGLHNGAWQLRLDEPADNEPGERELLLREAAKRLKGYPENVLARRLSPSQLTVTSPDPLLPVAAMNALVYAALHAAPALDVRVGNSGHSVDVTAAACGKHVVVERMAAAHGPVLAVGDHGDQGGNDFDLLAATPWSLSVDRCSADPGRCWSLAPQGVTGPAALVALLSGMKPGRDGYRIRVRAMPTSQIRTGR